MFQFVRHKGEKTFFFTYKRSFTQNYILLTSSDNSEILESVYLVADSLSCIFAEFFSHS